MPAISADTVALPRVPDLDPTAADRPVDPFVHMDQMGEVDDAPGDTQWMTAGVGLSIR